jgi:hypothetical protein
MNRAATAEALRYVFSRGVLRRNLLIALVVGTLLSAANQWDVVLREPMSARLGAKIFFNFVIPFVVSSVSAALNRKG